MFFGLLKEVQAEASRKMKASDVNGTKKVTTCSLAKQKAISPFAGSATFVTGSRRNLTVSE